MEFYVLNYDFNTKKVVNYNIFSNAKFSEGVKELSPEMLYQPLKRELDSLARWCFWAKREYEIFVGDAFEEDVDKLEKIDVYRQVAMNLDALIYYIRNNR